MTRDDQLRKAIAMDGAEPGGTIDSSNSGVFREATGEYLPQRTIDWGRSVTKFIVEHPEFCLVIAIALGAAIGVAVKRR